MKADSSAIDRLYAAPLDQFVTVRTALAKESGDPAAFKKLPKPNLPAWGLNQLVRRKREELDAFLRAGDAMKDAPAKDLAAVTRTFRSVLAKLVSETEAILAEAGHAATVDTSRRIHATLHAAAVDDEARAAVLSGRLSKDLESSGVEWLGVAKDEPAPEPTPQKKPKSGPDAEAERAAQRRREALTEARADLERTRAGVRREEKALEFAQRAVTHAEDMLRRAHAALETTQTDAARVQAALDDARAAEREAIARLAQVEKE